MKAFFTVILHILVFSILPGQNIELGIHDSIQSSVLNESRTFIIHLPKDYNKTDKSYPVLYRLDGNIDLYLETLGTVHRLVYIEEVIPEHIIVMIKNTHRYRDMMPTKTSFFKSEPGAHLFKSFIESELIPYINKSYRTKPEKILCGQSLSAIFTLYSFLSKTDLFNSYIVCSGGFPDCESYFIDLTQSYLNQAQTKNTKLFLSHGDQDFLDPDGHIKNQLNKFVQLIEAKDNLDLKLKIYKDEGHVPFQSLYHGLKFIYK